MCTGFIKYYHVQLGTLSDDYTLASLLIEFFKYFGDIYLHQTKIELDAGLNSWSFDSYSIKTNVIILCSKIYIVDF